jgi:crooked neck
MAANFEIRQQRLDAARQILGMAVGSCPKDKLFRAYIDLELQLGNVDRCGVGSTTRIKHTAASVHNSQGSHRSSLVSTVRNTRQHW